MTTGGAGDGLFASIRRLRERRERILRLRGEGRGPDQCSEREQPSLQDSSSISSSKSFHANDLFEG